MEHLLHFFFSLSLLLFNFCRLLLLLVLSACIILPYPGQCRGLGELLFCHVCCSAGLICVSALLAHNSHTHATCIDFPFSPSLLPLNALFTFILNINFRHRKFRRILGDVVFVVERCLQEYASLKILLTPI
jgi:hypothetical protein